MSPSLRRRVIAVVLTFACAAAFAASVQVATAAHWHSNCVNHGILHGESSDDASFFSRVEAGCSSNDQRTCDVYVSGSYVGGLSATGSTTCSAWSRSYGWYTECAGSAVVSFSGVFGSHTHYAHSPC